MSDEGSAAEPLKPDPQNPDAGKRAEGGDTPTGGKKDADGKNDQTEFYLKALEDGKDRAKKKIAKELGLESLDLDILKDALKTKAEIEDAKKSNEERLGEANTRLADAEKTINGMKSIIEQYAKSSLDSLPDEKLKKHVLDIAGDNALEQLRIMSSESFKELTGQFGALGVSVGQPAGSGRGGGSASERERVKQLFDKAKRGDKFAAEEYLQVTAANPGLSVHAK